jgi:hypothetical protein
VEHILARSRLGAACLVVSGGVATAIVLAFSDSSSAAPSKADQQNEAAKKLGAGIGFPEVCSSSNSTG